MTKPHPDQAGYRRYDPEWTRGEQLRLAIKRLGFLQAPVQVSEFATGTADDSTYLRGDGTWAHIEVVRFPVKNTSGGTLAKGTPVYITGSVGASGASTVAAANASNSATMPCIGLLEEELLDNGEGFATSFGVLRGLNTTGYTVNQVVFVAAGGGLTGTRPSGTADLVQNIGRVMRVDNNTGEILVMGPGRVNDVPNYAQARLLGRGGSSGSGAAQEITLGTGLSFSGTTLNATGGSGGGVITNGDYTMSDGFLLGRADGLGGSAAIALVTIGKGISLSGNELKVPNLGIDTAELKASAVTYAKMQDVSATDKLLGRSSAGAGVVEEIACTAAGRALIDDADAAAQRTTLGLGTMAVESAANYALESHVHDASDITTGTMATARLGSGTASATTFLRGDQTWATPAGGSSPVKFADAPINAVAVNSTTLVDLVSKTVTVTAGDTIEIELTGTILNNSGATRTYTYEAELGAFGLTCLDGTTVAASATNRSQINIRAVFAVQATNNAAGTIVAQRAAPAAADVAGSIATTTYRHTWRTTTSDLTGSQAVKLRVLSSAATATQTFTVFSYRITQHAKVI